MFALIIASFNENECFKNEKNDGDDKVQDLVMNFIRFEQMPRFNQEFYWNLLDLNKCLYLIWNFMRFDYI